MAVATRSRVSRTTGPYAEMPAATARSRGSSATSPSAISSTAKSAYDAASTTKSTPNASGLSARIVPAIRLPDPRGRG